MIKVIIFDADGVTIETEMFSVQYQCDFGVPAEEMLPFFRGVFGKCKTGEADLKEELQPWLRKWKWEKSVDEFLEYWFKTEDHINEKIVGEVKKLRARGIKCFLATNQEKYRTNYMRKQMGFNKIFDNIFSSAEVGFKKPDKEFFQAIMKELKRLKKQEILFWDDREKNILGAKKFGFKAYIYKNFSDFKEKIYPLLK